MIQEYTECFAYWDGLIYRRCGFGINAGVSLFAVQFKAINPTRISEHNDLEHDIREYIICNQHGFASCSIEDGLS
jgi:hypothetical protein